MKLTLWAKTSSKEWEDFNVHTAFNKTLAAAYNFKYVVENEDDEEDEDEEQ